MLERTDFSLAGRIELHLRLAGEPGRVVGRRGGAWGLLMARETRRGALGTIHGAVAAALGAPVVLLRRGRRLLIVARK
jgi:hypothetical protein